MKIKNKLISLKEGVVKPEELEKNIDNLVTTAKDSLDIDDTQAKDFVSGLVGEGLETGDDYERAGREIEYGINPEVGADEYEEFRKLKDMLVKGEEPNTGKIEEEGDVPTNDPVKLKADVEKLMAKLDMSSIAPYLQKIDNPVEQAEVIGQFAEKIGVPKAKLSAVVAQLKTVAESKAPKMTKNKLIEAVTGKKGKQIIKTIKVKDIK